MSKILDEELLVLTQAAKAYPGGGKHVSQLHRYRLAKDRPALECLKVGGIWMTSKEAMRRHVVALTQHAIDQRQQASDQELAELSAEVKSADAELIAAGF